jgi:aerobic carbon-monoxide dehydrogenase medium subunit
MNPSSFAYERAESVQDAIALLVQHGEGAKLIAGGHSLLPIMKLRLAEPERLIDIGRIEALRGVRLDDGEIAIGALRTHHEVASDPLVAAAVPLLADAASRVGDRQVRNRGTIGGALAHADAASDYPAAVLALEATIVAQGPGGERRIPAREFFLDFLTTALAPNEVLTEVRIALPPQGHGWSYQKLANQASGYAIVGVAALVVRDEEGICADVRVGVTGASAVAWRAEATEAALRGQALDDLGVTAAAALVDDEIEMLEDLHGSAEYRRIVSRGLTRRALLEAGSRAGRER